MMAYPVRDTLPTYGHQYAMYQTRAHQPQVHSGASISANPYAGFTPASQPQQQPHLPSQPQHSTSRASGSPDSEDGNRPSLPSISNLLGIADGDRPNDGQVAQQAQQNAAHLAVQQQQQQQQQKQQQQQREAMAAEQHRKHVYPPMELSSNQRAAIAPTPPLRNDSVVERTQSPSAAPTTAAPVSGQPYFLGSSLNNMDAEQQRVAHANFMKRHSVPSQPTSSPYGASPYTTSPYHSSPGTMSNGSYYSPSDPTYPVSNLYHQRPLPSNFPPPPPPASIPVQPPTADGLPAPNPWQHHHYISPSSQATFPQSQDPYICQTCNKAFSRPSSLKIHSHSHTGEKPFKCPHAGCGKAFSVRSNMKRHERGCHTLGGGAAASMGVTAQFV
ncbi:hypothetical protein KC338_g6424 [Hortaea werneckii]|nr:hypothetical protein KC338_g6424 [Hortaea werneckii]